MLLLHVASDGAEPHYAFVVNPTHGGSEAVNRSLSDPLGPTVR